MENPFNKYVALKNPSIVKFNIELTKGHLYPNHSNNLHNNIEIRIIVDTYIPYGTNIMESLDFNLYAMNDRSDVPDTEFNIQPVIGVKANVNDLIDNDKKKLESTNGVYKLDYTFKLESPFPGTNFNLLGVNIVVNRQSLRDGDITKENIYTTVIPTTYLDGDKENE